MIDANLIGFLADKLKIEQQDLIEKDIILQRIVFMLSQHKDFTEDFVFKGGTCLIKCYLGYYRFSEDLDFSFVKQEEWKGKSDKSIRKMLSLRISILMGIFSKMALDAGMDFKQDKNNKRYVEFGGSNKFVTFKLWYDSTALRVPAFVKIQINFVEKFLHPFKRLMVHSVAKHVFSKEMEFLFPEYAFLNSRTELLCYDLQEILAEKVRAILTRRGMKWRDFIDVYMILREHRYPWKNTRKEAIDKSCFMLRYEKYLQNMKSKERELRELRFGEGSLLLVAIGDDFKEFIEGLKVHLKDILEDISKQP